MENQIITSLIKGNKVMVQRNTDQNQEVEEKRTFSGILSCIHGFSMQKKCVHMGSLYKKSVYVCMHFHRRKSMYGMKN